MNEGLLNAYASVSALKRSTSGNDELEVAEQKPMAAAKAAGELKSEVAEAEVVRD